MDQKRLDALLERFSSLRIALAGDLFLDRWYEIDPALDEPSLETGKTAWQIVRKRAAPGAGGTVLNNLSAMGIGYLRAISMTGDDGDGWELRQLLNRRRVDTGDVFSDGSIATPSYIKPLFPEEGNRLDIKNFSPTPRAMEDRIIDAIGRAAQEMDAVILLDQVTQENCGVLTDRVRQAVAGIAEEHPGTLFFADSRAFIDRFRSVVIKCNNHEAAQMTGKQAEEQAFSPEDVFDSMTRLAKRTGRPVVITCNKHGIAVEEGGRRCLLPAVRHHGPIDICGAGDASTAGFVSTLCAGGSMAEAAEIANLTAGVTVRKLGQTGTATQEEIRALYFESCGFGS